MNHESCLKAFRAGVIDRENHPLSSGRYKLVELLRLLESSHEETIQIGLSFSSPVERPRYRHCTGADKDVWLTTFTRILAYDLGYKLIPGLRALTGDGVPAESIPRHVPGVETQSRQLVKELDAALRAYRAGEGLGPQALRELNQTMTRLIRTATRMTQGCLQLAP
jgi:hypothetical protein